MRNKFKKGALVVLSASGRENENYSAFAGETLRVAHVAKAYMPAKEFFAKGSPEGYHPGFDEGAGSALYDLETVDGKSIPCSLYEWELEAH